MPSPQGNGAIKSYLVRPANADKLPAVLVIHENRGLNTEIGLSDTLSWQPIPMEARSCF